LNYSTIFRTLHDAGVRYVLIGGMAVVLHGHPRFTQDMDIVLDLEPANAERFLACMETMGFAPRIPVPASAFLDPLQRDAWIREKNLKAFAFLCREDPFFVVDVLLTIPFASVPAVRMEAAGVPVSVIDRPTLIRMKRATGRTQDLADAEALESAE
jgi:hypothetical protein